MRKDESVSIHGRDLKNVAPKMFNPYIGWGRELSELLKTKQM